MTWKAGSIAIDSRDWPSQILFHKHIENGRLADRFTVLPFCGRRGIVVRKKAGANRAETVLVNYCTKIRGVNTVLFRVQVQEQE